MGAGVQLPYGLQGDAPHDLGGGGCISLTTAWKRSYNLDHQQVGNEGVFLANVPRWRR